MADRQVQWMRDYLELAINGMSRGRPPCTWREFLANGVPVAAGVSVLVSCGGDTEPSQSRTTECVGDECSTLCFDQIDNDVDGQVDCADDDCMPYCGQPAYGVPMEDCSNQIDDDFDGQVDCADSECYDAIACGSSADYAVPMPIENCGNAVDDDGDGMTDCADADCAGDALCLGERYGIPIEDCANGLDDDGDGALDCGDADCMQDPSCVAVPLYGLPMD